MPRKQTSEKSRSSSSTPAAAAGWFQSGYSAVGEEVERREQQQKDWENQVRRLYIPLKRDDGKKFTTIIMVDGIPFAYREHNFQINGSWRHWKTCLSGTGEACPYEETGNKNYFVGAYTVINLNEWVAKDGAKHKNEMELLPGKGDALKALRILADARGNDLSGYVINVSRTGEKSPNVGNVFDIVERLPVKKILWGPSGCAKSEINVLDVLHPKCAKLGFRKPIVPIDYTTVLKPNSREEALRWLGSNQISAGSSGEGEKVNEIPY